MTDTLIEKDEHGRPPRPEPRYARPPIGPPVCVVCPDCGHPVHGFSICEVRLQWWQRLLRWRTHCDCIYPGLP